METHALNFKINADQRIQIRAADDHISPESAWRLVSHVKRIADGIVNFTREKGDLTLVIFFEIKKSISANSASGHTLDAGHFDHCMLAGRLTVMAEKIVSR